MKVLGIAVTIMVCIGLSAMAAQAATVHFNLVHTGAGGTFDLFASTPIPDSSGIAGFNVDLVNILTATHESPKADDTALFVTRGFTLGRINLAGPGALFAGQNTTNITSLIYGVGQTAGTFPTNPLNPNDVGVPWTAPVLIASGTYGPGTLPGFGNEVLGSVFTSVYEGDPPPPEGLVASVTTTTEVTPEPATLALLFLGGLALLRHKRST